MDDNIMSVLGLDGQPAGQPAEQPAAPVAPQPVTQMPTTPQIPTPEVPPTNTIPPAPPIPNPVQPVQNLTQPMEAVPVQQVEVPQPNATPVPVQQVEVPQSNATPVQTPIPQMEMPQPVDPVQPAPVQMEAPQPVAPPVQPAPIQPEVAPQPVQPQVAPKTALQQPMPTPPVNPAQPTVQMPVNPVQPTAQPAAQSNQQSSMIAGAMGLFVPSLNTGEQLICKLTPGHWDAFVKVLSIMDDKNVISIVNSEICQSLVNSSSIILANLTDLIGSPNINLHVLSPKKYIKYFKNIKGESDIYIIDDTANQRYKVTNGDITVYAPKQLEEFNNQTNLPDLSQANMIGQTVEINKNVRTSITSMISENAHVDLLIKDNQFKAVSIPGIAVYTFKDYIKEQIDDLNVDKKFRAYSFLKVVGDDYKVTLGELGGKIWSMTVVNTGYIIISILECLQPVNDEELII